MRSLIMEAVDGAAGADDIRGGSSEDLLSETSFVIDSLTERKELVLLDAPADVV